MRWLATVLLLGGCGSGGLGPPQGAMGVLLGPTSFPLALDTDLTVAVMRTQVSDYSGAYCEARLQNLAGTAFGGTGNLNGYCPSGAAFDAAHRVFLTINGTLAVGTLSGPWANFALGGGGERTATLLSDGTYVACAGDDLLAVSPDGPLVYRTPINGTATLGLIADEQDRVFAQVRRADGTWRLVALDASGEPLFDVAMGEPQDTPSLANDDSVIVSAMTDAGAALQVFDPADGALLREVPLAWPAYSVVVADDGDWIVGEVGYNAATNQLTGIDTLVRMSPDGDERWSREERDLGPAILDNLQRLWVSFGGEVHILTGGGHVIESFPGGGAPAGPPVLQSGWFGGTYDAYAALTPVRADVTLATTGWPRAGGSNRNNGRRPTP